MNLRQSASRTVRKEQGPGAQRCTPVTATQKATLRPLALAGASWLLHCCQIACLLDPRSLDPGPASLLICILYFVLVGIIVHRLRNRPVGTCIPRYTLACYCVSTLAR